MLSIHGKSIDEFTEAYLDCAFWTEEEELSEDATVFSLAPSALDSILEDCAAFLRDNAQDIEACGLGIAQCGHDFWLTRNGHGAGFWDRLSHTDPKYVHLQKLTDACKPYGSVYVEEGDDGLVYFR